MTTPTTPSETRHQTTLITDEPVQIVVGPQQSTRWHRFLNELHDAGVIASLSDAGLRVLTAFLRLNDAPTGTLNPETGLVEATVADLTAVTRRGRSLVFKGRRELLDWRGHSPTDPRRLITDHGRYRYEVLAGWEWASRPATSPQWRIPQSAPADESSAVADARPAAPRERARANQPQIKTEKLVRPEQEASARKGAVVGWPSLDLFGERAVERGDAGALLKALGVWAYLAEPLGMTEGITCQRVILEAEAVAQDAKVGNKPLCLGKRLAMAFGIVVPPSPAVKRLTHEGMASGLEGIARLRIQRMKQQSAQRFHDQSHDE